jgi:hypothetical protein
MSTNQEFTEADGEQLRRLISAWCDGVIDAAGCLKLRTELASHAEARWMFLEYMQIHAGAHGQTAAHEYLESLIDESCGHDPGPRQDGLRRAWRSPAWKSSSRLWLGGGLAAAALVSLLAWSFHAIGNWPSVADHDRAAIVLARVVHQTEDCRWYLVEDGKPTADNAVHTGDRVRVSRGQMKLAFDSGTVVTLHAPAIFELISDMRARVLLGKLTARVAQGGEGFSVITPRATVIDLGTEFGIEVNAAGATDVLVFQGAVDLDNSGHEETALPQRRLNMGEGMHLDAQGTASRIVSITSQRFSDEPISGLGQATRAPVISAVRDNIQRNAAWNYYEIVPSGMREDARAYVDREAHEWNGIADIGMPAYLIDGDYVKMFNNDKVVRTIEVQVTVNRPCKLYVLFDDRLPLPAWLQESFRDTGDNIGMDVGPFVSKGHRHTRTQPGVGPGESVDDILSVWVREIKTPGTVVLGSTEAPVEGPNMYGIVAVPLETQGPASNGRRMGPDPLLQSQRDQAPDSRSAETL